MFSLLGGPTLAFTSASVSGWLAPPSGPTLNLPIVLTPLFLVAFTTFGPIEACALAGAIRPAARIAKPMSIAVAVTIALGCRAERVERVEFIQFMLPPIGEGLFLFSTRVRLTYSGLADRFIGHPSNPYVARPSPDQT